MATFSQGDVVRVPFPYTDQSTGQRRPALVISDGPVGRDLSLLWVVMITSAHNSPWPHDLPVDDLAGAGLPASSVIRTSKLATIETDHAERLVTIDRMALARVVEAVQTQLGQVAS